VTVSKIEWPANGGLGGGPAEWLIPARASAAGTPTLRSNNPDGTVQTYQGTEMVTGGKIVAAHIVQTS
jgi:hypothetical protein